MERLQKILSQAGIASRREAEKLIQAGHVSVNGVVVTQLGTQADPNKDRITVDGRPITISEKKAYYLFHKPKNVMVTRKDPEGRPTVYDYLKEIPERVNYVGRLDFDSEGLLLLTNDGELQAKLTHPRHEIPKTYQVQIERTLTPVQISQLQKGIDIGDYKTQPCRVRVVKNDQRSTWIEIILKEGKNRQIRRMLETLGVGVLRLIRVAFGPLSLTDLPKARWRRLSSTELASLKKI